MTEAVKHETVLDTGAEQLGKTYARALRRCGQECGRGGQVIEQLGRLVDEYLGGSPAASRRICLSTHRRGREGSRHRPNLWRRVSIRSSSSSLKVMAGRDRLALRRRGPRRGRRAFTTR